MGGMKDQLGDTLVYPHGPGHRGVETSIIAAKSMLPHVTRTQKIILEFIRSKESHGATYREILTELNALTAGTVCGRLAELHEAKLIKTAPHTRLTPSNRPARVYIAAEFEK